MARVRSWAGIAPMVNRLAAAMHTPMTAPWTAPRPMRARLPVARPPAQAQAAATASAPATRAGNATLMPRMAMPAPMATAARSRATRVPVTITARSGPWASGT